MRAFIAIELPENLKAKISEFQKELIELDILEGNWTKEYHLTLKFLHEITDEQVKLISNVLLDIAKKTKKFELELNGLGAFPSQNYIRVIWIGAGNGDEEAKELQRSVDNKLEKLGFEKENRYSNHLTLARVKAVKDKDKLKDIFERNATKSFGSFEVKEVKLIKSTLTGAGPKYETIATFHLS